MSFADALRVTAEAERALADALLDVSRRHASEPDIRESTRLLAGWCRDHARVLAPDRSGFGRASSPHGWPGHRALGEGWGKNGTELLQDLVGLAGCVAFVEACWTILLQAALASHDQELEHIVRACGAETLRQRAWLDTKLSQLAPQALAAPPREPSGRLLDSVSPHDLPPSDRRSTRHLSHDYHRGLRGPTRTTHLRDT
jgi:hypothetical protein